MVSKSSQRVAGITRSGYQHCCIYVMYASLQYKHLMCKPAKAMNMNPLKRYPRDSSGKLYRLVPVPIHTPIIIVIIVIV